MDDFVAEVGPKNRPPPPPFTPVPSSGDFVVEIRPRTPSEMMHRRNQCRDEDLSNQALLSILSGEHFSREGIARFLRGSILDIVEKLLIGRPLAGVEGHLRVSFSNNESPISVAINKTYSSNNSPNGYGPIEETLKESFNVRVKNGDSGMCSMSDETFGATSPLFEFEREQCNNVTETDDKSSLYSENHRDVESLACSPQHCLRWNTPTLSPLNDEPVMRLQAQVHGPGAQFENHRRHDSDNDDDESGYTSNEREDSDACCGQHAGCKRRLVKLYNSFNDYYCSGFDGDNTLYTPRDIRTAVSNSKSDHKYFNGSSKEGTVEINDGEEDFEFSNRLVIDESPRDDTKDRFVDNGCISKIKICKESSQSMDVDVEEVLDVDESNWQDTQRRCFTDGAQICPNGFLKDGDFHDSSDITDTDVPVDVSGDSNITQDTVSVFPHIQSPVFKHPDGFRCKECSHILEDVAAVAFHVQTHHDLHFCTICYRTFTAKNNLKRHLRIHTGQRPYKCTICPQSFARRDDLKDHTLRHEYNNPFRCSVCKRGYTDRASVKNHMAKEHGSRLMHVCPQCGESHDDEESFAAHKKTHPELQQFSCSKCSFIGTNHQMAQKHTLVHTYKLFTCKPCNAHFADPFDYTNHIRKHKKSVSFCQYICCFCDLTLSTYDQFIRHEYSHAQAKTYGCKTCKKIFKTKSLLQDHAIIHQDLDFDKAEPLQQCVVLSPAVESRQEFFKPSPEEESIPPRIESAPEVETIQRLFKPSPEVQTIQRLFKPSPEVQTIQRLFKPPPEVQTFQPSGKLSPEVDTRQRSVQLSSEFNEPTFMLWQPSECQDTIAFSPSMEPRSPLDSMPSPRTDSPTSKTEETYEFQGELLDLSMKKPTSSITRTDDPRDNTSLIPCSSETRISEKNFRRNDVVLSNSCFLSGGHEENEQAFRENTEHHQQGRLHLRTENSFDSSMNSEWDSSSSPEGPISPNSLRTTSSGSNNVPFLQPLINGQLNNDELDGHVDDYLRDKPGRRLLSHRRSTDCVQKPLFRFSPYSREKIADLAAKFVAARGTDIFHQRAFLKTVTPSWKNRHEAVTLNTEYDQNEAPNLAQLKRKGVSTLKTLNRFMQSPALVRTLPATDKRSELFREVNSAHEISREESNPETALSHAVFLVKPEPLVESDLPNKDVVNGRLHRDECGDVQMTTSSVCEDCKEVFGSFSELETHSVEMHKRFLCEHCKKSFTARPNRDRHVRYHTGERPYKCDLCDMAFFRGDDLKYHRTTRHPSAQPFICSRCDASFAWRRDLDRHIRHSKCKS